MPLEELGCKRLDNESVDHTAYIESCIQGVLKVGAARGVCVCVCVCACACACVCVCDEVVTFVFSFFWSKACTFR